MSRVHVVRPGMLTTVQDTGRSGMRRHGVVQGGAMDGFALRCANILARNAPSAAALECTVTGPELEFEDERVAVVTGAAPRAELNGAAVVPWSPFGISAGAVLVVRDAGQGCRAYIAISGGIAVDEVLGSRSTDLSAGFGGCAGRALEPGDALSLGPANATAVADANVLAGRSMMPRYSTAPVLRILPAPETDRLGDGGMAAFVGARYEIAAESNRMGCRLNGEPLTIEGSGVMISSPVTPGTIQLPPSGQPIILTADAQTIGGYPRIAHVVSVDLPVLAQLRPGHVVRFAWIELREAEQLAARRERDLRMLTDALRLRS